MIPRARISLEQRLLGGCVALVAVLAGCSPSSTAPPAASAPKPEIYGVWLGAGFGTEGFGEFKNTGWMPVPSTVFTPWGAAESKRLADPQTSIDYCRPGSPAGGGGNPLFPSQIVKADNQVMMLVEGSPVVRRIYTDGRPHPEEPAPTFLGDSIGHWEGDTLVVDTIATRGGGRPLNGYVAGVVTAVEGDYDPRLPLTNELHVTERIRLVGDGDILETVITLNDPKAYTQPFTATRYSQRRPDLDLLEYYCDENPRPDVEGYIAPKAP